jgi:hypothetical protein
MSKISDLVFRYLHRKLPASKTTPTQHTASGGSLRTATCEALTEAADYWNGAIVRWDIGGNVGQYSSVRSFDAASRKLGFDEDLPLPVLGGDKFTLFLGGLHASNQQIPGLNTSTPVNITGFSISYAGMLNGEGTGTLKFYYNAGAAQSLSWTPPGEAEGVRVDISGLADGQSVTLYGGGNTATQKSKFIQLNRNAVALPTSDKADDLNLLILAGSFLGAFVGSETESGTTVYRPICLENTGVSALYFVKVFCAAPWLSALPTSIAVNGGIGTGAGEMLATSFVNWGVSGWIYNSTKNDIRYFFNRSGNTVSILNPERGMRGFTAVPWDDGDDIEPFPWFDIGFDAPGAGNVFEDPSTENTAPADVVFSCPRDAPNGLVIGNLSAGALCTIWERFFIPAGFQPLDGGRADLHVYAEATE